LLIPQFLKPTNGILLALFFLVCAIYSTKAAAQGPTSHGLFGYYAAIQFENHVPHNLPNTSAMYAPFASATISDAQGALQYYARPDRVYNRSHVLVESGEVVGHAQSYQGAMLIPHMVLPSRHYLITNNVEFEFENTIYAGHYIHEIEQTWAYPDGEIKANKKNILFSDSTGMRLTAVHHANGRDIWVIFAFQKPTP